MAKGDKPDWKFITKNEATGSWESLIAAWRRDDGSYSVQVNIPGIDLKSGLFVEGNRPFTSATKKPLETTQESLDDTTKGDVIPF